ncbi:MAG: hypothetical protein ABI282_05935, partial [Candidatus Baltobacteraceae bacterium]
YGDAGPFAATYARALDRFLAPEVSLRLTGSPETTAEFREAAFRLPAPLISIATQPSSENAAYVCCGTVCAAPVRDAAGIRDAYDSVARVTG